MPSTCTRKSTIARWRRDAGDAITTSPSTHSAKVSSSHQRKELFVAHLSDALRYARLPASYRRCSQYPQSFEPPRHGNAILDCGLGIADLDASSRGVTASGFPAQWALWCATR